MPVSLNKQTNRSNEPENKENGSPTKAKESPSRKNKKGNRLSPGNQPAITEMFQKKRNRSPEVADNIQVKKTKIDDNSEIRISDTKNVNDLEPDLLGFKDSTESGSHEETNSQSPLKNEHKDVTDIKIKVKSEVQVDQKDNNEPDLIAFDNNSGQEENCDGLKKM